MKKSLIVVGCLMVCMVCTPAFAQEDYAPFEVFGGYNFTRFDGDLNMNGWGAAFTYNLNPTFGINVDIGGAYKSESASEGGVSLNAKTNILSFMAGPQAGVKLNDFAKVFGHALFGFTHLNTSMDISAGRNNMDLFDESTNGFSMAFGGGIDWQIANNIAIRAPQFDYIPVKFEGGWSNNTRLLVGIVFQLGK